MYGPKMMMIFYGMLIQVTYNLIIDKKLLINVHLIKGDICTTDMLYIYIYTWNIFPMLHEIFCNLTR